MTRRKFSELDKPDLMEAMLTGKYAIVTRVGGHLIGIFSTYDEALEAATENGKSIARVEIPYCDDDNVAQGIAGLFRGIAKRQAEGRFIPPNTLRLAETFKPKPDTI